MKQGSALVTGNWQGTAAGGVTDPDLINLPDPETRFATTAARLAALAPGHRLEDWLSFMARLASAQWKSLDAVSDLEPLSLSVVDAAADAAMPPLAIERHARAPVWRTALSRILDSVEEGPLPAATCEVIAALRAADPESIEALADRFLRGVLEAEDVGGAIYIAAALQVYFTKLAATLPVDRLRLLPQRGLCPCCGSPPTAGVITASGKTPGTRYLHCSLCSTAWTHLRATCITCGDTRTVALQGIEGSSDLVKAETCDACGTYSKTIYQKRDMKADPHADDLESLALDMMVAEAGWARHAPNPLLLIV